MNRDDDNLNTRVKLLEKSNQTIETAVLKIQEALSSIAASIVTLGYVERKLEEQTREIAKLKEDNAKFKGALVVVGTIGPAIWAIVIKKLGL